MRLGAGSSAPSLAAVMFTDVVGSTALRGQLGEAAAEELRRAHDRLVTETVEAHGGKVVKGLGDGAMAALAGASEAVEAAVAVQRGVERLNRREAWPVRLELRVGLSVGEVVWEEGDCFGTAVIEAARLCSAASGGQILASDLLRVLAGGRVGELFTPVGALTLKGLAQPLEAVEVAWRPRADETMVPLPAALELGDVLPFVSREDEYALLLAEWKQAVAGGRSAVFVAGEPGIGKTRLVSELATAVHREGAVVLFGRCDEAVGISYQPFVEALTEFMNACPVDELRGLLGPLGGELAWLLPTLPARVSGLAEPLRAEPETERYRLFEAVVELLAALSSGTPVLLVLDDLHWADAPTLLLLRHVLRANEPMRLLTVGTYRDTDVGRSHPLTQLLADLRRSGYGQRVGLSGLDQDGVAAMVAAAAAEELSAEAVAFAHDVHAETGGNAFFVEEVLRHLVETGTVVREGGRWVARRAPGQLGIPEGVREVVGQRLARLPQVADEVLSAAAVIGQHFEAQLLAEVVDGGMPAVVEALEAAEAARLVTAMPGRADRYSFAHALVRSTVYDGLATSRRRWLHRAVGLVLEGRADRDERLGELAHHFAESIALGEADRAIAYARQAGDHAGATLAFEQAAAHYQSALKSLELAGSMDTALRCDLQLALGAALYRAGDAFGAVAFAAADSARTLGDPQRLAAAALLFVHLGPGGPFVDPAEVALIEEALERLGPADNPARARLLAGLAAKLSTTDFERSVPLSRQAMAMARRLADATVLARVLASHHAATAGPEHPEERLAVARELAALGDELGDADMTFAGRLACYMSLVEVGDVDAADAALDAGDRLARELRQPVFAYRVLLMRASQAILACRLAESEQLAVTALQAGRETGLANLMADALFTAQMHLIRDHQGRLGDDPALSQLLDQRPDWPFLQIVQARLRCAAGRAEDARPLLRRHVAEDFGRLPRDILWLEAMLHLVTIADALSETDAAARLDEQLRPYSGRNVFNGITCFGPVDRALGVLATVCARCDDAEAYFAAAVEQCERMRAHAWATRTRGAWARMLAKRGRPGDLEESRSLAARALADATRLGMAGDAEQLASLV